MNRRVVPLPGYPKNLKVLCVEDNPGDARLLREILKETGMEIELIFAHRLDYACRTLGTTVFDVILLDLSLPDAKGLEAVERIRTVAPDLPIVVLTGLIDEAVGVQCVQKGAQDYLVKDHFDGASLKRALRYAIERQRTAELTKITEELAEARDSALQSVRLKSEFMANMSHEIRTPMNAIIGMAELLSETTLTPIQKEYVDIFRRSGDHLLTVINDILDLSKVDSGILQLDEIDFDLGDLMENTLKLLAIRAHEKGLQMAYHIAPEVPTFLSGDPDRLRQVITNVVGNAIKFTEHGDILLQIKSDGSPGEDPSCRLQFAISDTGIGIAPDKLSAVFESFVQGDSSITRKYGGTGLGLTISKKIVELMGGSISVTSDLGKGSRFCIVIPFVKPKGPPSKMAVPYLRSLKGVKTMIVDDNPANRFLAGQLLSAQGLSVVEYESVHQGAEEIQRAQNSGNPYQLLVVDMHMQGLSGFDMLKYLHAHMIHMGVVMVSSADPNQRDLARCRDLGIAPPLVKPVKTDKLLESIRHALDRQEEETPKNSPSSAVAEIIGRQLHILLVEDSPDNQMLILAYLKNSGHTVDLADNGKIAVKRAAESSYDLILMDMQMPVMDGYTATRAIRTWESQNNKTRQATPIVALTAYALKEEVDKSFQAGCTGHLTKPIKKTTLLEVIHQYAKEAPLAV